MSARGGPRCGELVIVAPNYEPAIGGGAIYYRLLAEGLVDAGLVDRVEVLTEAHPGCPRTARSHGGRLVVRRVFPYRTARPDRHWSAYPRYMAENLGFFRLLNRRWRKGTVLLVHASFHLYPNTLRWILPRLRRRSGRPALVSDVRDPRLPSTRFRELAPYDHVIACSRQVARHMRGDPGVAAKLTEIPVLIDVRPPSPDERRAALARHGLRPGGYVFWANGVSRLKNIEVALAAMSEVRTRRPDLHLAVAGRCRDWDAGFARAEAAGVMRYLGPLDNREVLALNADAAMALNISEVEGVPRGVLEAAAVGGPLLLPPNVPEFAEACPGHLAESRDPGRLAGQILDVVEGRIPACHYPLAGHQAERVLPRYVEVFQAALAAEASVAR